MKFLLLLCILPCVLCAPSDTYAAEKKRFVLDSLHLENVFNLDSLKCDIQLMLDVLGNDPTEKACEDECHKLIAEGHYFNNGCPLVCHGFQNLVHVWHVTPDTTDPAASKCHHQPAATTMST